MIATHQVYGGLAHAKAEIRSPYAIATVGSALDVEAIKDAPNAQVVQKYLYRSRTYIKKY